MDNKEDRIAAIGQAILDVGRAEEQRSMPDAEIEEAWDSINKAIADIVRAEIEERRTATAESSLEKVMTALFEARLDAARNAVS